MFETRGPRSRETPPAVPARGEAVQLSSPTQLKEELRGIDGFAAQEARLKPPQGKSGAGGETLLVDDQQLFATPARIAESNAKLAAAGTNGSFIRLGAGTAKQQLGDKALQRVEPRWVAHERPGEHAGEQAANMPGGKDSEGKRGGKDRGMALARDCGKASAAIMGSGMFDKEAVYREGGQEQQTSAPTANMMSNEVYLDLVPDFVADPKNAGFLKDGVHFTRTPEGGQSPKIPATAAEAEAMYWELGEAGRDAFDRAAGINAYADPEIGEAYVTTTERAMPGFEEASDMTWNYHWAGVVMKDGPDNITLEAFAVTQAKADAAKVPTIEYVDRHWSFALYGGVDERGEVVDRERTFHEQRLATAEHGNRASTLRVGAKD